MLYVYVCNQNQTWDDSNNNRLKIRQSQIRRTVSIPNNNNNNNNNDPYNNELVRFCIFIARLPLFYCILQVLFLSYANYCHNSCEIVVVQDLKLIILICFTLLLTLFNCRFVNFTFLFIFSICFNV